jgi:hypothetical protein
LATTAIGLFAGVGLTVLGPLAVHIATAGKVEVSILQFAILGAMLTVLTAVTPAGMTRGLWLQAGVACAAVIIVVTVGALAAASLGATAPLLGFFAAITFVEATPTIASAEVVMRRREHSHA